MYLADGWKDYEVLSTSRGEKYERWGRYRLVRPDPQVIWEGSRADWDDAHGVYHRSAKGGGSWELHGLPKEWSIGYSFGGGRRLSFRLKPFSFKHTGLFPEQAANWEWFVPIIESEVKKRGKDDSVKVLNLFAYTGGATAACAMAGAHVTHVDASKGMVQWAKDNLAASGLAEAPVRYIVDDCEKFVAREIRRGRAYDGIILDPPSYGRGPGGEVWKMEDRIFSLLSLLSQVLSKRPLFVLINSYTTGLQPLVLKSLLSLTICRGLSGAPEAGEVALPVKLQDIALPCGASARWCMK